MWCSLVFKSYCILFYVSRAEHTDNSDNLSIYVSICLSVLVAESYPTLLDTSLQFSLSGVADQTFGCNSFRAVFCENDPGAQFRLTAMWIKKTKQSNKKPKKATDWHNSWKREICWRLIWKKKQCMKWKDLRTLVLQGLVNVMVPVVQVTRKQSVSDSYLDLPRDHNASFMSFLLLHTNDRAIRLLVSRLQEVSAAMLCVYLEIKRWMLDILHIRF